MHNPQKNPQKRPDETRKKAGKPALQLTSGQVGGAIVGLLAAACILFVSGILVERFYGEDAAGHTGIPAKQGLRTPAANQEGGGTTIAQRTMGNDAADPSEEDGESDDTGQPEWTQSSPRVNVLDEPVEQPKPRTVTHEDKEYTYVPVPPAQDEGAETAGEPASPSPPEQSAPSRRPGGADGQDKREEEAADVEPANSASGDEPAQAGEAKPGTPADEGDSAGTATRATGAPEGDEAESPSPPSKPASSVESGQEAAGPNGGFWTVQLASFQTGNRDLAEKFVEQARENADIIPEIVEIPGDGSVKIVVGRFDSREEAVALQDKLREREEFAQCWARLLK